MNTKIDTQQCFSRDELKDYCLGRSADYASARIEQHLRECEICEDTIVGLDQSEDTLVHSIKDISAARGRDGTALEPMLRGAKRLIERASEEMAAELPNQGTGQPQQIGEYELLELIGGGGMGKVYRARHVRLEKEFAVKILATRRLSNHEAVGRFQREMKMVGKLDHPSIVQATDAGESDGMHYLTMEYVSGLNLAQVTHFCDPISVSDACELVRQTALAIEYAHENDIVHRDIKPSNLMLTEEKKIKILDLGLATLSSVNDSVDELTTVGQLMGTLDYMAPEQCDSETVDHRCDIYSMGCTLFKLLTNRTPFSTDANVSPLQKIRAIAIEEFTPIDQYRSDLPIGLIELIHRCLHRDPAHRFQSAAELAEALQEYSEDHNLQRLLSRAQSEFAQIQVGEKHQGHDQPLNFMPGPASVEHPKDQARPSTASAFHGGRSRLGWLVLLILGALVPLMWMGIQIVINWEQGQLVIESDSANVRVKLLKDGEFYKEMSLQQGVNSTKIRAGKYEIVIDGGSDQLVISGDTFQLKRGETTIAKISTKPNAIAGTNTTQSTESTSPSSGREHNKAGFPLASPDPTGLSKSQTTYDGLRLVEWLNRPLDQKVVDAVENLLVDFDKNQRAEIVKTLITRYRLERSEKHIYYLVAILSKLCPDSKSAERILDYFAEVHSRMSTDDLVMRGLVTRLRNGGQAHYVYSSLLNLAVEYPDELTEFVLKRLKSGSESEAGFAIGILRRLHYSTSSQPGLFPKQREKIATELVRWIDSKNRILSAESVNRLASFKDLAVATEGLRKHLDKINPGDRMWVVQLLIKETSQTENLIQYVLQDMEQQISRSAKEDAMENLETLLDSASTTMISEIKQALANKEWGKWLVDGSRNRSQSELAMMLDQLPSSRKTGFIRNRSYQKRIFGQTVRAKLIDLLAEVKNKKLHPELIEIIKNEMDVQFIDGHILVAADALDKLAPDQASAIEKFWARELLATNDDAVRKRALENLGYDLDKGKGSSLADLLVNLRPLNAIDPDPSEQKLLESLATISSNAIEYFNPAEHLSDSVENDRALFQWLLKLGNKDVISSASKNRQPIGRWMQESDSMVIQLRMLDLRFGNADRFWSAVQNNDLNQDTRVSIFHYLASAGKDAALLKELRSAGLSLKIDQFERAEADELLGMIRCLSETRLFPQRVRERSLESNLKTLPNDLAQTVSLFLENPKVLRAFPSQYEVDIWDLNSIKQTKSKLSVGELLLTLLKNRWYTSSLIKGREKELAKSIEYFVENASSEEAAQAAKQVHYRIRNAKRIEAYRQSKLILDAARLYKLEFGNWPAKLNHLYELPEGVIPKKGRRIRFVKDKKLLLDPWSNPFEIKPTSNDESRFIISAGPDGRMDSPDDVTDRSEWVLKPRTK